MLSLVSSLRCPYCFSGLSVETLVNGPRSARASGVLRCGCYRYPVLSGIPILRQQSPEGTDIDPIVALIDAGELKTALRVASRLPPAIPVKTRGIRRLIAGAVRSNEAKRQAASPDDLALAGEFRSTLNALKAQSFAEYLYYRHSNPSFMAATILICLLRELDSSRNVDSPAARSTRILDLSCGLGHTSFLIGALFPKLEVVAADWDFCNLRLAQQFIAPGATLVCVDAEMPLPFSENEFSACLCLDGLHYIRSKAALLRELDRVLQHDAIWLFPHLHNALQKNVAPGVPLAPDGWQRLLEFIPNRLVPESDLIANFSQSDLCDLACGVSSERLEASQTLAAVATRRKEFWRVQQGLSSVIAEAAGSLGLNPLWQVDWSKTRLQATACWPSEELRGECALARTVLPESLTLEGTDVARAGLEGGDATDPGFLRELIRRFVLVPLPPGYPRAAAGRRP